MTISLLKSDNLQLIEDFLLRRIKTKEDVNQFIAANQRIQQQIGNQPQNNANNNNALPQNNPQQPAAQPQQQQQLL